MFKFKRHDFPEFYKMIPGSDWSIPTVQEIQAGFAADAAASAPVSAPASAPASAPKSAPAPAPAPAPDPARYAQVTAAGGSSLYGYNLKTAAGRAAEAAARKAEASAIVAQSYATQGNVAEATKALNTLDQNISGLQNLSVPVRVTPKDIPGKTTGGGVTIVPISPNVGETVQALTRNYNDIQQAIKNIPTGPTNNNPIPTKPTTETKTPPPSPFNPVFTSPVSSIAPPSPVLIPGRDVINFETPVASPEAMIELLFEQIAGYELINIARRDTIDGQNPLYTLISNLSSIRRNLDPAQIISAQKPFQTGFERYEINLSERIPGNQYLLDNNLENFYYIADNGDLVIELDNLSDDEEIEVQMAVSGKIT